MNEIDLINQALNYLGEPRIQSLTQNTTSAKYASDSIELSVRQVLRLHDWNSAQKRIKLSRLVEENLFGFKYNYQLPNDYIRLVSLNDYEKDFKIEGRILTTDEDEIELLYIAYPRLFSDLDPGLIECIASKLAFNIAINVTGDKGAQVNMLELHERQLARARTNDAQESSPEDLSIYRETLRDSEMIQMRNSTRYSPTRARRTSGR